MDGADRANPTERVLPHPLILHTLIQGLQLVVYYSDCFTDLQTHNLIISQTSSFSICLSAISNPTYYIFICFCPTCLHAF